MPLPDSTKMVLSSTVKEWAKFAGERDKLTQVSAELSALTRKVIQECLVFMKTQNIDIECDTPDRLKMLGVEVFVNPLVEATFPNVKASVVLKCGGATRAIVINPNMTVSAGGIAIQLEQLRKGIPDPFVANAAEFVRDSFLNVARTGGKTE